MKQNKETLKEYFETGDKPTQEQYSNLIDSYIDSQQEAGEANRRFVIDETGEVSVDSEIKIPEYTLSEIKENKLSLLKDGISIQEIDLTSYIDDTNLSRLASGAVDEKGLATFTRDDSSTFTVDFSSLLGEGTVLPTNLSYVASTTEGKITSSTGSEATIPLADATNSGLMKANFYEEGTWNITINDNFTYEIANSTYTRVGNKVYVDGLIHNINGTTSDSFKIGGLPFISKPDHRLGNFSYIMSKVTPVSGELSAILIGNSSSLSFVYKSTNNITFDNFKEVSFTSGTLRISGVYTTNIYTA